MSWPASHARAAAAADPTWPCVQRLVPELAAGQMWQGEAVELPAEARLAPALEPLPAQLAAPGLQREEAQRRISAALAQVPEAERATQAALLFRETLKLINAERSIVISGIRRYAERQQRLAKKISQDGRRLVELRRDPAQAEAEKDLAAERSWDMRVFDDRQRSLRVVCDQPVALEQHAFAISRLIQEQVH